jgi:hypothetical protein
MNKAMYINYNDFTYKAYRQIIKKIKENFKIIFHNDLFYNSNFYLNDKTNRYVIIRHDVDFSVDRALELAKIESKNSVYSSYFFLLHSDFYNIFERRSYYKIKEIINLGHKIGLHFDTIFYGVLSKEELINKLNYEKYVMENLFEVKIEVFSLHNPNPDIRNYNKYTIKELANLYPQYFEDYIAGMINTYGSVFRKIDYLSDSNGYYRYKHVNNVIEDQNIRVLQVLFHPDWWVKKATSPRKRIVNILRNRSRNIMKDYDKFLKEMGRENIK